LPDRCANVYAARKERRFYKLRKQIVEPVFGPIKAARGIRAFLLRGFGKVQDQWKLICDTYNLLKPFRASQRQQVA
jgi:hypothetical protein